MNSETALRQQLREAGYAPIPVNGKRPALEGWQTKANTKPQEINEWEEVFFYAKNTGLLTEHTPTLDIDILDQEAATAVEELVRERFGERGHILVRFGQSPKRAIPFRTDTPFSKITYNFEIPDREDGEKSWSFLPMGNKSLPSVCIPKPISLTRGMAANRVRISNTKTCPTSPRPKRSRSLPTPPSYSNNSVISPRQGARRRARAMAVITAADKQTGVG